MVFVSGDSLHKGLCAALMDDDQTFVDRDRLKADLARLTAEWESLSDDERKERKYQYGSYPPPNPDSITYQLWHKLMKP